MRGEQLALEQSGGRAGAFIGPARLARRRRAAPAAGRPSASPRTPAGAVATTRAIAYLGEFNSGAHVDLAPDPQRGRDPPGLAVRTPTSGSTRARARQPGEPDVLPDRRCARSAASTPPITCRPPRSPRCCRPERVKRVFVVDDIEVYGHGLAGMVRRRLKARGDPRRRPPAACGARNATAIARAIRRSRADAMVYGGITENGAARLWHAVAPPQPAAAAASAADGRRRPRLHRGISRGAAKPHADHRPRRSSRPPTRPPPRPSTPRSARASATSPSRTRSTATRR